MVEELRQVFERVQQQPDEVQRRIAALIALELEERDWDTLVGSPASQRFLMELATEACAEITAGKTRDLDELL